MKNKIIVTTDNHIEEYTIIDEIGRLVIGINENGHVIKVYLPESK